MAQFFKGAKALPKTATYRYDTATALMSGVTCNSTPHRNSDKVVADAASRCAGIYSFTISTRRFLARPASSSFEAIGAIKPAPAGFNRSAAMP